MYDFQDAECILKDMFKLLVVDDEEKERNGITVLIKKYTYPFETFQAKNGVEALGMIRKGSFDVLLTDIRMPFMNGLELIKEVQKLGDWMIFIIYSAFADFEYAQSAVSLGVLKYLLKPITLTDFRQLFTEVETLCLNKSGNEKTELHELLFNLSHNTGEENNQNRIIKMAEHLILANYADQNLSLSFLADKLNISSAYLSSLFKAETGWNISAYITDIRISRAKQILKQGNLKVNEVGLAVGYANESYFIKLFKEHEGMSPAQFRLQGVERG